MSTFTNIQVGDSFLIEGGANEHGNGTQIAVVHKVTKRGNVYCFKISHSKKSVVAKNHRLDRRDIIERFPFALWLGNDISAVDADSLEKHLNGW